MRVKWAGEDFNRLAGVAKRIPSTYRKCREANARFSTEDEGSIVHERGQDHQIYEYLESSPPHPLSHLVLGQSALRSTSMTRMTEGYMRSRSKELATKLDEVGN